MKIVKRTGSASALRLMLPILWALGIAAVVGWAGCGGNVNTTSASAGTGASVGHGTSAGHGASAVSSVGSSSSGVACTPSGTADCPGNMPSPQTPCPQIGLCCDYTVCSHQPTSGFTDMYVDCIDAGADADSGIWQWQ